MQYILFLSSLDREYSAEYALYYERGRERELKVRRLMSSEYGGKKELANGRSRRETRLWNREGQTYDVRTGVMHAGFADERRRGKRGRGENLSTYVSPLSAEYFGRATVTTAAKARRTATSGNAL